MKKFLAVMLCCLMMTACASQKHTPTAPAVTESEPASAVTHPTAQETKSDLVSFTAYRGNETADGLLSREVLVPQITPDIVMSALIEDGVLPADVSVLTLTQSEQQLFINFNNAFAQHLMSMGTAGETILMNSVVNTFLSAYSAQSIMMTVEGGILESGHVIYDFPLTHQA